MKKLLLLGVITSLLAPCLAWGIMPFRSADEARAFFIKTTFKPKKPIPMPPYDYDSGPIVSQRLKVADFKEYNPAATEKFNQFVIQVNNGEWADAGVIIDGQSIPYKKILDDALQHVEAGADFTLLQQIDQSHTSLSIAALAHNHAPLLKALLNRGQILHLDNFTEFSNMPRDMQQLLLTRCKKATNIYEENVLHSSFLHHPKDVYNFCRHSVDANKKNSQGETPLHYLLDKYNDKLLWGSVPLIEELTILQKVAALMWHNAQLSSTDNHGKTALDWLIRGSALFKLPVMRTAQATAQVKSEYEKTQVQTPLLLEKHIATSLVPIVMGYVQPTWLHELWPAIQKQAGVNKEEQRAYDPASSLAIVGNQFYSAIAFA